MFQLSKEYLTRDVRSRIVKSDLSLFWTDDWSAEFYRLQAQLGFIATSVEYEGRYLLLPELQTDYAVLDWRNLVIDPGVRKTLKYFEEKGVPIRLILETDLESVLKELESNRKGKSWISPPYRNLMNTFAHRRYRSENRNFQVWGARLIIGDGEETVAVELGYSIGRVYTSLSGFFHREERRWNHLGKAQLVLLAKHLQARGIEFWNLGHPSMQYKIDLGARIIDRRTFLSRWDEDTALETPWLGT
ncbi:MAG: GNAT family N-acetyltransferase [Spirochaetales bacterium]|nr:GNAT family N-acetyltransferase [Spirochaetales bacterium]